MAIQPASISTSGEGVKLSLVAEFRNLRVLAWRGDMLYAACGYRLLRAKIEKNMGAANIVWEAVAEFHPAWWRNVTSSFRLSSRLVRDGFHALACLSTGHLFAAVPGAIVMTESTGKTFRVSHRVLRGTRPLHFAVTPEDRILWGEYFDNPGREEVHIYSSNDQGASWNRAYTFASGTIRHVHNILYDRWDNCLWVLTGDDGDECRILRTSYDFKNIEEVLSGNQQARAVAAVIREDGLYFSSDTPFETNHVYHLNRRGQLQSIANLESSSIYGCGVDNVNFFSTMIEPSEINLDRNVRLYGALDGGEWKCLMDWKKDGWPDRWFQYGNAFLPDGDNSTDLLAVSTIAVRHGDMRTSLWRVSP